MFEALETGIGLDIVLWFQGIRFGLLDVLAKALDFAGEEIIYIIVLALIYWVFSKGLGVRMLVILAIVTFATFFFKDLLARERPYLVSDAVQPLFEDIGYGLPSGHTSMTLAIWGFFAWWIRKTWVTIVVTVYIIVQAFGRIYAGVHFPQDVVAGLALGAIVLALFIPLSERWLEQWRNWSPPMKMGISFAIPTILTILVMVSLDGIERWEGYLTMTGIMMGTGFAVMYENQQVNFAPHPDKVRRAIQFILGIVLTAVVLIGLDQIFDLIAETGIVAGILRVIRYELIVIFALGFYPYLSMRFGLMQSDKPKNDEIVTQT